MAFILHDESLYRIGDTVFFVSHHTYRRGVICRIIHDSLRQEGRKANTSYEVEGYGDYVEQHLFPTLEALTEHLNAEFEMWNSVKIVNVQTTHSTQVAGFHPEPERRGSLFSYQQLSNPDST